RPMYTQNVNNKTVLLLIFLFVLTIELLIILNCCFFIKQLIINKIKIIKSIKINITNKHIVFMLY
ncbi:unnamed protein product, partial [marine sediment metagenome]